MCNLEVIKEDIEMDIGRIKGVVSEGKSIETLPRDLSSSLRRLLVAELNNLETEKEQIEVDLGKITTERGM